MDKLVLEVAQACLGVIKKHPQYEPIGLAGMCEPACDLLLVELGKRGLRASKHHGWCLYDSCDHCTGEPCAPHYYVLVHKGRQRWYLDITAVQFQPFLEGKVESIIYSEDKPYWFRPRKPTMREMEAHAGYY